MGIVYSFVVQSALWYRVLCSGKSFALQAGGHKKRLKFHHGKVDTLRECGILSVVKCVLLRECPIGREPASAPGSKER